MIYQICGFVVESDIPLPGVVPNINMDHDVFVRLAPSSETFQIPSKWFMQWHLPGGELWLSFAKIDGGFFLRFNELADFFVSGDGKNIVYVSGAEIPLNTIRHLLLDQVIPLVINLRGKEALHASVVLQ